MILGTVTIYVKGIIVIAVTIRQGIHCTRCTWFTEGMLKWNLMYETDMQIFFESIYLLIFAVSWHRLYRLRTRDWKRMLLTPISRFHHRWTGRAFINCS